MSVYKRPLLEGETFEDSRFVSLNASVPELAVAAKLLEPVADEEDNISNSDVPEVEETPVAEEIIADVIADVPVAEVEEAPVADEEEVEESPVEVVAE